MVGCGYNVIYRSYTSTPQKKILEHYHENEFYRSLDSNSYFGKDKEEKVSIRYTYDKNYGISFDDIYRIIENSEDQFIDILYFFDIPLSASNTLVYRNLEGISFFFDNRLKAISIYFDNLYEYTGFSLRGINNTSNKEDVLNLLGEPIRITENPWHNIAKQYIFHIEKNLFARVYFGNGYINNSIVSQIDLFISPKIEIENKEGKSFDLLYIALGNKNNLNLENIVHIIGTDTLSIVVVNYRKTENFNLLSFNGVSGISTYDDVLYNMSNFELHHEISDIENSWIFGASHSRLYLFDNQNRIKEHPYMTSSVEFFFNVYNQVVGFTLQFILD